MKWKVSFAELSVDKTLLGLPHIVKTASETWSNSHVKLNCTLAWSVQQEPCCEMNVMPKVILRSAVITRMNLEIYVFV